MWGIWEDQNHRDNPVCILNTIGSETETFLAIFIVLILTESFSLKQGML